MYTTIQSEGSYMQNEQVQNKDIVLIVSNEQLQCLNSMIRSIVGVVKDIFYSKLVQRQDEEKDTACFCIITARTSAFFLMLELFCLTSSHQIYTKNKLNCQKHRMNEELTYKVRLYGEDLSNDVRTYRTA